VGYLAEERSVPQSGTLEATSGTWGADSYSACLSNLHAHPNYHFVLSVRKTGQAAFCCSARTEKKKEKKTKRKSEINKKQRKKNKTRRHKIWKAGTGKD
jgi:hypothetical protein